MSIDTMNYAKVNYLELDATYSEGICIGKDNKVYVCNSGNTDDTQAGEGTTISVLPLTLGSETQITVPKNPKLIAAYSANKMYFNVLGDGGMHSALYKFNPTTPNVAPTLVTEKQVDLQSAVNIFIQQILIGTQLTIRLSCKKYNYLMMILAISLMIPDICSVSA